MALNGRQRRFCDEYMANGGNAYQAALKAGYADKTARKASEWLNQKNQNKPVSFYKAEMVDYITKHSKEMEKHSKAIATAEELQEFVTSVMRGDEIETVVAASGKTASVPANIKDRLRSADMLAKMKGMYTENYNVNADMDLNIKIDYGDEDGYTAPSESDI